MIWAKVLEEGGDVKTRASFCNGYFSVFSVIFFNGYIFGYNFLKLINNQRIGCEGERMDGAGSVVDLTEDDLGEESLQSASGADDEVQALRSVEAQLRKAISQRDALNRQVNRTMDCSCLCGGGVLCLVVD